MAIPYFNDLRIVVNQTAKNDHVSERAGCTLKECVRAVWNTLPYNLTNDMIVSLAYYACRMINIFPKVNSSGIYPLENCLQEFVNEIVS